MNARAFIRWTELDQTTLPEFLEEIQQADVNPVLEPPRSYPGYPRRQLDRVRPRRLVSLDRTLQARRSSPRLGSATPSRRMLSRLLHMAHGITGDHHRGPVPSAGGLQALELYLAHWSADWLPAGLYHYDRAGHHLSQIAPRCSRDAWLERVPSLRPIEGGAFLWIVAGDAPRVTAKYGARGYRFLLLEAGHLMQNLCLLSASLGLATVPLGGGLEHAIAAEFQLPRSDVVLYTGVCG
jgi:SagB-type dehydrogenase family enzyme